MIFSCFSHVSAINRLDPTLNRLDVLCHLLHLEKPMRIELIFDPAKAPPPSLVSRVTPASSTAASAKPQSVQRFVEIQLL